MERDGKHEHFASAEVSQSKNDSQHHEVGAQPEDIIPTDLGNRREYLVSEFSEPDRPETVYSIKKRLRIGRPWRMARYRDFSTIFHERARGRR